MYKLLPVALNSRTISAGIDQVIAVIPVPEGGFFQGMKFNLHAVSKTKSNVLTNVMGYALSIYKFPILDPDTAWVPDTVWDQQLPKDDQFAANDLDMDTTGLDTTPDVEWGDANPALLAGITGFPTPIYKASRMISFANSKGGFEIDGVSGGNDGFIPTDIWSRSVGRGVYCAEASAVMVGISSYNFPTPLTDFGSLPASDLDWDILRYADDYQNDARKALVGGITSGTQEVAAEALAFLNSYIEQNVEFTGAHFLPTNWEVTIEYKATVMVPGQFGTPALSSGQPIS